ncbi:MAG: N-6 DNA methylase [Nitrospirota bacterium]|nr:N-6 DNA methylase [Nitrospirota bacterium]
MSTSPFTAYLKTIEHALAAGNATEHTHRPALKNLVESLASNITAVNEPKRIRCGAPDFIVTRAHIPLGYIEAKDVGASLGDAEENQQLKRYRESLGNLILTDYLEFRWYVSGEHRLTTRLAKSDANKRLRFDKNGLEQTTRLLQQFLSAEAPTVGTPKELAARMAAIAQLVRNSIRTSFDEEDLTDDRPDPLHDQLAGFRKVLIHDLTPDQFADMYAQTICYGLFAARCNHTKPYRFTREHAAYELPRTNPFLRKMFTHIAGPDLDERIAWAVDDLAELLNKADMEAILTDFGKHTRREDPVVHFYETFLAHYDPKMREARGVYYTPEPVVSYIVRSVDHILKKDFKLKEGLADAATIQLHNPRGKGKIEAHKVQILDPAAGTGTFLYGVIDLIQESLKNNKGLWSGYVSKHLLPRLHGFELLMAPYAVAHMKLGLQLAETGYDFKADERLRIYLTNTLEEAHEMTGLPLFTQWLADEANSAAHIKRDLPIMVVLGNPPYSNFGMMNKGKWIMALLEAYKKDLNEKKINLDDDFIKFIRFGQWRIEQTGAGILAFITNNTYIDGLTHRRMRQSLMETFSDIYILDLHGSIKKKEKCPDGSKDENVFDIQQGVTVGIFVKKSGKQGRTKVRHAELWGKRSEKYEWLMDKDVATTAWRSIEPQPGNYFFVPKELDAITEYSAGWSLTDIFQVKQNGIKTDRDNLFFDFNRKQLEGRIRTFYSDAGVEPSFREEYRIEDSSSYDILSRRLKTSFDPVNLRECLYRPFDVRWLYYSPGLTSRPAWAVMRHMLSNENVGIITTRQASEKWDLLATRNICGHKSCAAYDINTLFPLYLHPQTEIEKRAGEGRCPNLSPAFISKASTHLGMQFVNDGRGNRYATFGPEDVLDYMYAVFHSPTYRKQYAEFLKIDFPRLPLTSNANLFRELCLLGEELVGLHLMDGHVPTITSYPIPGDSLVENVRYAEPGQGAGKGRVWINEIQYFEGVPPEVWNFHIGGYQVCQKWLKDRKGRRLTYDDLTHYQHIVAALAETIRLMGEIDAAIEKYGGWPIK